MFWFIICYNIDLSEGVALLTFCYFLYCQSQRTCNVSLRFSDEHLADSVERERERERFKFREPSLLFEVESSLCTTSSISHGKRRKCLYRGTSIYPELSKSYTQSIWNCRDAIRDCRNHTQTVSGIAGMRSRTSAVPDKLGL